MKIMRVFPRRTYASPNDDFVRFSDPGMFEPEIDEVHVSVTFTWDMPKAERLAYQWERFAPVKIGGPATGMAGSDFTPGMYLKPGYTITSRGCPNRCWFCSVWKRDGDTRELPIRPGWNILDDNLLACSETHIQSVFEMLKKQRHKADFTGGLEAARLRDWHVNLLKELNPRRMYFAYDTPDDLEPLIEAGRKLMDFSRSHRLRCYVLVGFPGDTISAAEKRLKEAVSFGFMPFAMLWRDERGKRKPDWVKFVWPWTRPQSTAAMMKETAQRW